MSGTLQSSERTGEYDHLPKIVPIVLGINLNWRFRGASRKAVVSAMTILASVSVPKYATSTLFLREMAHILK